MTVSNNALIREMDAEELECELLHYAKLRNEINPCDLDSIELSCRYAVTMMRIQTQYKQITGKEIDI